MAIDTFSELCKAEPKIMGEKKIVKEILKMDNKIARIIPWLKSNPIAGILFSPERREIKTCNPLLRPNPITAKNK